ncbi:MAG TPA: transketolase [Candidatus Dormibacteraeota bacterium]|nr:transketolase [Candidatus Dormibacteraeota bacterium]
MARDLEERALTGTATLPQAGTELDNLCINTIRTLAIDAVEKANSGHPGLPMGMAPAAYVLWTRFLRHDPTDPKWPDRDRFVLSAGHGSMLLYALLHLTGYDLPLEQLQQFRQWGSITPGHPELGRTAGVEVTTGPLGQGFGNGVGLAIAERHLAARYNQPEHGIVDHRTFVLCSDGDLMEGISSEAASLAGHLGLGKLICLYDDNHVSLDGPTSLSFSEDVGARFRAYGWQVQRVEDGTLDLEGIAAAIEAGITDESRPSLIAIRTHIGYGAPHKQDTNAAHGSPLGAAEAAAAKRAYGWDPEKTFVEPEAALAHFRQAQPRGAELSQEWNQRFCRWSEAYPELAYQWRTSLAGELPAGWEEVLPTWEEGADPIATRSSAGKALAALAESVPWILGGDADLSESTKTAIPKGGDFDGHTGAGRNLHFGVREHAMGAACNGIAAHGGLRPYSATFFTFSDYQRPSVRLSALSHLGVVWVYTHDSIGLGEDGPTHQPVEQLAALRAIPDLVVLRPGDANESSWAWAVALERATAPTVLVLCRQNLPVLAGTARLAAAGVSRGAYVLQDATAGTCRCVLIGTGSELSICVDARALLEEAGVPTRVVSMPSMELFAEQPDEYRSQVLPPEVPARVAVEAGVDQPWWRWVGERGAVVGVNRFGASAPYQTIYQHLGLTPAAVADRVHRLLGEFGGEQGG